MGPVGFSNKPINPWTDGYRKKIESNAQGLKRNISIDYRIRFYPCRRRVGVRNDYPPPDGDVFFEKNISVDGQRFTVDHRRHAVLKPTVELFDFTVEPRVERDADGVAFSFGIQNQCAVFRAYPVIQISPHYYVTCLHAKFSIRHECSTRLQMTPHCQYYSVSLSSW